MIYRVASYKVVERLAHLPIFDRTPRVKRGTAGITEAALAKIQAREAEVGRAIELLESSTPPLGCILYPGHLRDVGLDDVQLRPGFNSLLIAGGEKASLDAERLPALRDELKERTAANVVETPTLEGIARLSLFRLHHERDAGIMRTLVALANNLEVDPALRWAAALVESRSTASGRAVSEGLAISPGGPKQGREFYCLTFSRREADRIVKLSKDFPILDRTSQADVAGHREAAKGFQWDFLYLLADNSTLAAHVNAIGGDGHLL